MKNEFVPYDIALAMKELGFDERCYAYHSTHHGFPTFHTYYPSGLDNESKWNDDVIITPLYQQAFRWFDENSEYQGFVIGSIKENAFDWEIREDGNVVIECDQYYTTREEAQDACLRKLIEIVKEK